MSKTQINAISELTQLTHDTNLCALEKTLRIIRGSYTHAVKAENAKLLADRMLRALDEIGRVAG